MSKFPLFRELFKFEFSIFVPCVVTRDKFRTGVPLCTENCKKGGLIIFEIIELGQSNLAFLTFEARGIQKSYSFLK